MPAGRLFQDDSAKYTFVCRGRRRFYQITDIARRGPEIYGVNDVRRGFFVE